MVEGPCEGAGVVEGGVEVVRAEEARVEHARYLEANDSGDHDESAIGVLVASPPDLEAFVINYFFFIADKEPEQISHDERQEGEEHEHSDDHASPQECLDH